MGFVSAKFEHKSGPSLLSDSVHGFQLNTYLLVVIVDYDSAFERHLDIILNIALFTYSSKDRVFHTD